MYTRDVTTGMQFVCITLPLGIKAQSQQHDKRTESLSCWWGESAQRRQIIMVDYTQQSIWRDQIFGWGEWIFSPFFPSCVHMIDVATADDKNVRLSIINFCHKWWISLLLKQDSINGEGMKTKREEVVPKTKHLSTISFTHLAFLALSTFVEGSAYRPTRLLIPMSYCLVLKICSRSRSNSIGLCCFSSLSL